MVKESIHQEFGRFLRDEMDDNEREKYIISERYKQSISLISKIFKKNSIKWILNRFYSFKKQLKVKIILFIAVHLTFVLSGVLLAYMDSLTAKGKK